MISPLLDETQVYLAQWSSSNNDNNSFYLGINKNQYNVCTGKPKVPFKCKE